ncbi:acyl-CoA thioesterase domain-containing protein [Nonomuraea lactucae]|uniref:acyl-CoA thioesterase domain-containing protein n=1 Tax=Nonomuraea lactucae TaxID=2249762 RepID=UPI001F0549E2|nr:acyl-CoA thioesterase domain-containing protein [Nonomuraea lactucae]
MTSAFFTRKRDEFVPAPHARGPWAPDMLHGRLVGGLVARALEERHGDAELQFARLTVDLFRNSPLLPVTVETSLARDGRRIRVADATVSTDQGVIARASAVLLRKGEQPGGELPFTPGWDEPPPREAPPRDGVWNPPFDMWPLTAWGGPERDRAWIRESRPLVDGEPLTPFTRVALAGDFASPLSAMSPAGVQFINGDYTLTLTRLPEGELIGMEATGHLSAGGVATGHCTLHDTAGPIGFCLVTAVANPRPLK